MSLRDSRKVIPFPEIENAFIVISCAEREDRSSRLEAITTFFYGDEQGGAEWEPNFGPIDRIIPCDKDYDEAQLHWFYPFYKGPGHWSQLAVNGENLPGYFLSGDYKSIFNVLKKWAKR